MIKIRKPNLKNQYKLSKLLKKLGRSGKKTEFTYGIKLSPEWARFCIRDLDSLKKHNAIDGKWSIIDDPKNKDCKLISITKYKKLKNLHTYWVSETCRELWTWMKLNYRPLISLTLFIVVVCVAVAVLLDVYQFNM